MAPPDPGPADPAADLAYDCTDDLYVMATNGGDSDAELDVYQGQNLIDTITVPAGTKQRNCRAPVPPTYGCLGSR